MKKIIAVILAVFFSVTAFAAPPEDISARSAVLVDKASGRLLYEKNGFEKLPMASTTKIMTALLVIQNCKLTDVVTVSPTAAGVEGSSLWLEVGEELTVEQLLYGLMLKSGNDAAVALAEHTAGSVDAFVVMMNAKAKEIGMFNTSFETPNGLDGENHYTTAYDMAVLTRYAMTLPAFRNIVATKEIRIPWGGYEWDRVLKNHNKLLWQCQGCTGVKTGFTKKAGRCLVSTVMRDGRELIAVTLNDPDDWNDHQRLYDFGFEDFVTARLTKAGQLWETITVQGMELGLVCGRDFITSLRVGEEEGLEYRVEYKDITLPIKSGQTVARLYIFSEGEFLGGVNLNADRDLNEDSYGDYILKISKELI